MEGETPPFFYTMYKEFINIKYTDEFEKIQIRIKKHKYVKDFTRNQWTKVPIVIAELILKNPYFLAETDIFFKPDYLNKGNLRIGLKRFGAYGDLIQLIPVVKFLKRTTSNKYFLLTNRQYINDFKNFEVFDDVLPSNYPRNLFDKVLFLDGVLECDHSLTNHERYLHRINIFESFFGINIDEYDFSVNISEADKIFVNEVLKNAIIQQK